MHHYITMHCGSESLVCNEVRVAGVALHHDHKEIKHNCAHAECLLARTAPAYLHKAEHTPSFISKSKVYPLCILAGQHSLSMLPGRQSMIKMACMRLLVVGHLHFPTQACVQLAAQQPGPHVRTALACCTASAAALHMRGSSTFCVHPALSLPCEARAGEIVIKAVLEGWSAVACDVGRLIKAPWGNPWAS